jgi:hypothetical protein
MKKGLVLLIITAALAACTNNYKPEVETVEIQLPNHALYSEDCC